MENISWNTRIFQSCGLWQPRSDSLVLKLLYNSYTCLVFSFITALIVFKFVKLTNTEIKSISDLCSETFLLPELIIIFYAKGFLVRLRQSKIERLFTIFELDCCKPKNGTELKIVEKYVKQFITVRSTFVYVQIGLLLPFIHALFTYEETMDEKNLPYPGWDFFEITSPQVFWATYFYQVIAGVFGDAFQIAHDSMFCGLTSLTCAQADLIKHRLINLPKLKKEMRYKQLVLIVCQHVATKRLISQMQEIFGLLITWQFCSLTVNSSMNIYSFTAAQNVDQISSLDLITLVAYLAIVTEIIFFYCWFGNELIVQTSSIHEAIIQMNWIELDRECAQSIMIILAQATKPAKLTIGIIVDLSLDTFLRFCKMTYGTYNMLRTITNKGK